MHEHTKVEGAGVDAPRRQARRTKVVDGRLQYRIIAVMLTTIVAGLLLFGAALGLFAIVARGSGKGPSGSQLLLILPALLLNDLAIMLLVIIVGIVMTHRIAGPAYRIEADIERALSGERGVRVRLRRRDAYADLAEKVNQLLERIDGTRTG
jgi:methyl-accepting chemotaxis protein